MIDRDNRREFLGLAGTGVAGVFGGAGLLRVNSQSADVASQNPELVVLNAKAYTMDTGGPRAEAFAVKSGRFSAVGSTSAIKSLIGKRTDVLDAKQMTVVPGFTDCHNHATGTVLLYEVLVGNPFEVEFVTIASIVDKLRAKARATPAGTWVEGFFFDDTKLQDQRKLNVHDLDQVSNEQPVVVRHRGGHTSFYNSKALRLAGVGKNTPDPPGGTFDRDPNGDLKSRTSRSSAP